MIPTSLLDEKFEDHALRRKGFGVIRKMIRDDATVADIWQETQIRAWQARDTIDQNRNIDAWFLTIARNLAIDYLRSNRTKPKYKTLSADTCDRDVRLSVAPTDVRDRLALRSLFQSASANLTDSQRVVIELGYWQGLSHAEMAEHLGIPLGTIKTWCRSALQVLREASLESATKANEAEAGQLTRIQFASAPTGKAKTNSEANGRLCGHAKSAAA